jgi:hypothetical protein
MIDPDFIIENHGSIVLVEPVNDEAMEFASESLDIPDWAWMGPRFTVDHRMAGGLLEYLEEYGFRVGGV